MSQGIAVGVVSSVQPIPIRLSAKHNRRRCPLQDIRDGERTPAAIPCGLDIPPGSPRFRTDLPPVRAPSRKISAPTYELGIIESASHCSNTATRQ